MKELYFENQVIVSGINYNDPVYDIREEEFNQALLKFGAYISILKNKKVNQTTILLELLKNDHYLKSLMLLSNIDNTKILLFNFIKRYPIIYNSKIIQKKIATIMEENDRAGKKLL